MDGLLLIDKPKGWTSFDVVAKVRSLVRQETGQKKPKVGHAGTLDPLATGLMIVMVGRFTKQAEAYTKKDKVYQVSMRLGVTSTTGDEEGEKRIVNDQLMPSFEQVEAALKNFTGVIEQTPPAFSAVKINGQRAYKLARAGKEVKIEPRKVTIYQIDDVSYEYPRLNFTVKVSSGTYIRSLVEDIGQHLETGAYMTDLRRTAIGGFSVNQSHPIDGLDVASQLLE